MKNIGILLAILLIAGVCAMADDAVPAEQGAVLFADIDAVALSQTEMAVVDGGQYRDMDGSYNGYGPYDKIQVRDASYVPTKTQAKESLHSAIDLAVDFPKSIGDVVREVIRYSAHRLVDCW
ncbi:MAG TPA: hypothetical protein VMX33_03985 [bacterium]|nr:hypothetical protein [bacterium]